MTEYTVFKT